MLQLHGNTAKSVIIGLMKFYINAYYWQNFALFVTVMIASILELLVLILQAEFVSNIAKKLYTFHAVIANIIVCTKFWISCNDACDLWPCMTCFDILFNFIWKAVKGDRSDNPNLIFHIRSIFIFTINTLWLNLMCKL